MSKEVVIYTKPGCPYCRAALEDFAERGILYTEYDVAGDPAKKEEAIQLAGEAKLPVIVQGGNVTVGFGGS